MCALICFIIHCFFYSKLLTLKNNSSLSLSHAPSFPFTHILSWALAEYPSSRGAYCCLTLMELPLNTLTSWTNWIRRRQPVNWSVAALQCQNDKRVLHGARVKLIFRDTLYLQQRMTPVWWWFPAQGRRRNAAVYRCIRNFEMRSTWRRAIRARVQLRVFCRRVL